MAENILDQVRELEGLSLDSLPANIQAGSNAIEFTPGRDDVILNHLDARAYEGLKNPFIEELRDASRMDMIIEEGHEMLATMYTYRNTSKALPVAQSHSTDGEKYDLYTKLFRILDPEIRKIGHFNGFQEKAIKVLVANLNNIAKPATRKEVISEDLMVRILAIVDVLARLDAVKDTKTCLRNDFAMYKRAFSNIRNDLDNMEEVNTVINELQFFLSNPKHNNDLIMFSAKAAIHKVAGFEDILSDLLDFVHESITESRNALLPNDKHMFYRAGINVVFFLDGEDKQDDSIFRHKKIKLDKMQKLFLQKPVLPIYFDMQTNIKFVLERCMHYDRDRMERAWVRTDDKEVVAAYSLRKHLGRIRSEHNGFISRFATVLNEVKARHQGVDETVIGLDLLRQVFRITHEGLYKMGEWNALVMEEASWKRAFPLKDAVYKERGGSDGPSKVYEKVTSFHYSSEELYTLCDVIGMVKAIAALLREVEYMFAPLIRQYVYLRVQTFVQQSLTRPMRKAFKRKRHILDIMVGMRDLVADWSGSKPDDQDYKQKKKEILEVQAAKDIDPKVAAPNASQLMLLRRMMFAISSPRAPGNQGGFLDSRDLKKEWLEEWEELYRESFYYSHVLQFRSCVREAADMSHLWFREFYLEISKCVQFPISMSMPWIMTEFLVKTPTIAENLCFPLDIYNDVADQALFRLKRQFVYDEIEAEVNLAFEQLVGLLASMVFTYFKGLASSIMIEKKYKDGMEAAKRVNLSALPAKYATILSQRNIKVLGRSINIQALLAEHMNNYFKTNIEYAVARFEASDLCSVVELETILQQIKLTHALLAEHLSLDSYKVLFTEVNEETSVGSFRGRIVVHVYTELITDIFPNYAYNSATMRFVPASETFTDPPQRAVPLKGATSMFWYTSRYNRYFETYLRLTKGFFGRVHILALFRLLDMADRPVLFDEVCNSLEYKTNYVLSAYVTALLDGFDPMKLPSVKFGVIGAYGYFDLKLKPIAAYSSLRSKVFQVMREIGNMLAFQQAWDLCHVHDEVYDFQITAYLNGITPRSFDDVLAHDGDVDYFKRPSRKPFLDPIRSAAQVAASLPGNPEETVDRTQELLVSISSALEEREPSASLFTACLTRLARSLEESGVQEEWSATAPASAIIDVETPKDFCRFFNAIQFLFAQVSSEELSGEFETDLAIFGDGFCWAGCALLYLTGHRNRFEYQDFVYYILQMQEIAPQSLEMDPKAKKKGKLTAEQQMYPFVAKMLHQGSQIRQTNDLVFSILESHIAPPPKVLFKFHPIAPEESADTRASLSVAADSLPPREAPAASGLPRGPPPPPPSVPRPPNSPPGSPVQTRMLGSYGSASKGLTRNVSGGVPGPPPPPPPSAPRSKVPPPPPPPRQ